MQDAELSPAWIEQNVIPLLTDAGRLAGFAAHAKAAGAPDADEKLAEIVLAVAS